MNYKVIESDDDYTPHTFINSSGVVVTETGALLVKGRNGGDVIAGFNNKEWIRFEEVIN